MQELSESSLEAIIIEKEKDEQRDISSTYVREELDRGNIEKANALLGEPYTIHGTVVHGNHIGGTLFRYHRQYPASAGEASALFRGCITGYRGVGKWYGGVSNIGRKPTIQGENPVGVETFIMGLDEDLYGKNVEIR